MTVQVQGCPHPVARHDALTRMGFGVAHYPPSDVRERGADWAAEIGEWLALRAEALAV